MSHIEMTTLRSLDTLRQRYEAARQESELQTRAAANSALERKLSEARSEIKLQAERIKHLEETQTLQKENQRLREELWACERAKLAEIIQSLEKRLADNHSIRRSFASSQSLERQHEFTSENNVGESGETPLQSLSRPRMSTARVDGGNEIPINDTMTAQGGELSSVIHGMAIRGYDAELGQYMDVDQDLLRRVRHIVTTCAAKRKTWKLPTSDSCLSLRAQGKKSSYKDVKDNRPPFCSACCKCRESGTPCVIVADGVVLVRAVHSRFHNRSGGEHQTVFQLYNGA